MSRSYIFDKVLELKEKFKDFFTHKKKFQALENYSSCAPNFHHKDYLPLIKRCMNDGFLETHESDFIGFLLEKYEINFLDWSHKTMWLKGQMRKMSESKRKVQVQPMLFDLLKDRQSVLPACNVPMNSPITQQSRLSL